MHLPRKTIRDISNTWSKMGVLYQMRVGARHPTLSQLRNLNRVHLQPQQGETDIWKRWTRARAESQQREARWVRRSKWGLSSIRFLMIALSRKERNRPQTAKRMLLWMKKTEWHQDLAAGAKTGLHQTRSMFSHHPPPCRRSLGRSWSLLLDQKKHIRSSTSRKKSTDSIISLTPNILDWQLSKVSL